MLSLEAENSTKLQAARSLQSTLENTRLHLVDCRDQFDSQQNNPESEFTQIFEGRKGLTDPAVAGVHVASQIVSTTVSVLTLAYVVLIDISFPKSFLRKLKVQYLEQKAKDQYIKTIVSDDAPNINAEDNERLRLANEQKKEALKLAKARLIEKDGDIRKLAPLVEQDFNKARTLTNEAATLASKILDARLQLTRLRQAYPHPRLTIPAANAQLDMQVAEMQRFDDELQSLNESVDQAKDKVKEGAREVERLRAERAEVEKLARAGKDEVEDGRVVGLYDWLTASLALHRALYSLQSFHSASENELRLTYLVPKSPSPSVQPMQIRIILLFVPNTRQLADAQIEGLADDCGDVVGAHVQANDVPGLIAAVLARARSDLQ
ncbi:uncharacterized protein FIBRA_00608 [Fibroporia radiculosa]|uniref:Kinetochore protein Sos7 coiled-coil domain-containing protein n=1 Tax=Fibroporia radiculosa TaxID=599839 RepID=J4I812_9APHY|nr:uncharacterized protein FIBRA_00608 [Fibroporia radiculosa]CCL98606.1 predicted protein [Fibroporia radiculosa]